MSGKPPFNFFAPEFGNLWAGSDFAKLLNAKDMGGFDMNRLMQIQQRNLELMAACNRQAVEAAQAIAQRQAELMRQAMADFQSASQGLETGANAGNAGAKQAELARKSFENALAAMREIGEMAAKSNTEIFRMLSDATQTAIEEFQAAAKPAPTPGPASSPSPAGKKK
ncbi:MAG: hypothetical protein FJX46_14280 [Alphaproteobacteria bacterium]|nr:hypothetical protein [Alphaproteobacteria bacterium]